MMMSHDAREAAILDQRPRRMWVAPYLLRVVCYDLVSDKASARDSWVFRMFGHASELSAWCADVPITWRSIMSTIVGNDGSRTTTKCVNDELTAGFLQEQQSRDDVLPPIERQAPRRVIHGQPNDRLSRRGKRRPVAISSF